VGVYDEEKESYRRKGKFAINGVADIISHLSVCGVLIVVYLEVKTGSGVQSQSQQTFENKIKKEGGYYFVVRSVVQAVEAIQRVREDVEHRIRKLSGTGQ
jgi:hypothetical protein